MPELRKDPVVGRWVIIASERSDRPLSFKPAKLETTGELCPFCSGHEDDTPPEVYAVRNPGSLKDSPGWEVRVVPNKFPALKIEGDLEKRGFGIYDRMNGIGAHEVIIESASHTTEFSDLSPDHICAVLDAYRSRMIDLKKDSRFQYIQIFKNHGEPAGATLEHPHAQLIATPILPRRIVDELRGAEFHYSHRDRCIFCDMVQQEINFRERIVAQTEHHLAFSPFAPRFPFETWILPRQHEAAFEQCSLGSFDDLALILKETIIRINLALNRPAYNFVLHTAPIGMEKSAYYHWHFEVMPKLTKVAGFEWGTGFYINPTPPEEAAAALRNVVIPGE